MKLFQWTGMAPDEAWVDHRRQVPCAAVFPSKAAFMRATGTPRSYIDGGWVYVSETEEDHPNPGARVAIANPGVVYYEDSLRHSRRDAPWLVHPDPERS